MKSSSGDESEKLDGTKCTDPKTNHIDLLQQAWRDILSSLSEETLIELVRAAEKFKHSNQGE